MSGFPACSTVKVKDLKNSENSVWLFQIDFLSIRESLKESMKSVSDTQYHGPDRGREVLQIVPEVSRGLSKTLFVVSAGVEVWCGGELGLATGTLLLLLCHGPGGRGCLCWGCRVEENFKPAEVSYDDKRDKMWRGERVYKRYQPVNSSKSMTVFYRAQGRTRRVTWPNVRHTDTQAHAWNSFLVLIPCLSLLSLAFSYRLINPISSYSIKPLDLPNQNYKDFHGSIQTC